MLTLPDDILFVISESQKSDPNILSEEKPQKKESKLKSVLRLNLVNKKTPFDKYKKTYYTDIYKNVFDVYEKQFEKINQLLLPPPPVLEYEVDEKIDLPEKIEVAACDKPGDSSFFGQVWEVIKKVWDFFHNIFSITKWANRIRKLISRIKKIKNIFSIKKKKRGKSFLKKVFKKAKKFGKAVKQFLKRQKTRLKKFWRKRAKPLLKRLKKWLIKNIKRWAKKLKTVAKKVIKKILRKVKRFILKRVKKILLKIVKKLAKQLIKQAVQWLMRIVGTAISATGIGAVVGVALIAASIAWTAYDIKSEIDDIRNFDADEEDDDDEEDDEDEKEGEEKENNAGAENKDVNKPKKIKKGRPENSHIPPRPVENPNKIEKGSETDKVLKAFKSHSNQRYQIIGELFEIYEHTQNWLYNMDEFQVRTSNAMTRFVNNTLSKLEVFVKNHLDLIYDKDLLWNGAKIRLGRESIEREIKNIKKDKSKIKPRPKPVADWKIDAINKFVLSELKNGNEVGWFGIKRKFGSGYSVDITNTYEVTNIKRGDDPKLKTGKTYWGNEDKFESIRDLLDESNKALLSLRYSGVSAVTKYETMRKEVDYNPADISKYDGKQLFMFDQTLKKAEYADLNKAKTRQMRIKNRLLYDTLNRIVWLKKGVEVQVSSF